MRKLIISLILAMTLLSLSGCGKSEKEEEIKRVQINTESDSTDNDAVIFAKDAESFKVDLLFVNVCGVDIGMLSIIDPSTQEQINVSGMEDQTSIAIGANWSKDETMLHWALYNMNGELCIEGSSDLTGIKESATIVLSGEGDVTDINVTVN